MSDSAWGPWSDDDLRLLLERARATGKLDRAAAIASELARRQDGFAPAAEPASFTARERGFLEDLFRLLASWEAAFEADERLFLRVGDGGWLAFQHLDAAALRAALERGGPPARVSRSALHAPSGLAPELGGLLGRQEDLNQPDQPL